MLMPACRLGPTAGARAGGRRWPAAGGIVAISAIVGYAVWILKPSPALQVVRFTITTSGGSALTPSRIDRDVAITPDGSRIVYGGSNQLLVRGLDQFEPA